MALYQKSVLNKHLKQLEQHKVSKAYKKYVKYFLNPTIQDNIRNSKEEEYQGIFLTELFVNVLDYTLKPNVDFNLVAEYKNQSNSRKADGAILSNNVAIGVIELKGTKTKDLESIRQQAFDYKANQKECVYVITSNYEKLRFYINDATEYEEFNLFELTEERFELLYLCLQKDNILNNIPLKTKEASIVVEEQITKQFYKDYSIFKRELFRDLVKRNAKRLKSTLSPTDVEIDEDSKADQSSLDKNLKLALFKKSQKLIDRFLFVFFAEDRGLLPPNSTIQILNKWKSDVDFGDERPLYDMFKQYFKFLDTGRQGTTNRAEIYAYNGGLFKEDSLLDKLEIDNELLFKHTQILASYDFESQVDVNILGHIFENSLNEIESVNAEIEGGDFDKQKSKRKKDGVFYTPKYITKYIVENTIGKLCEEKKNELGFKEEEYFKGRKNRQQTTIVKLVEILDIYRDWLLQLTICDPACGSGAFLNQALDLLIKEHNYIDELKAKILGGGLVFSDIENTILEKNIYGVDLNEESVEIAKLSLWLRTAQPRRKLNSLNNNIKCGNSLIESKAVAGDKAFNWQEQFPIVFEKGGFDVIIGNPPYVRQELFKEIKPYLEKKYKCYNSIADLYTYFIELGIKLTNQEGKFSFILPNKFLKANYGKEIRKVIKEESFIDLIFDFDDYPVFDDATTYPLIFILNKDKKRNYFLYSEINKKTASKDPINDLIDRSNNVDYDSLENDNWQFQDDKNSVILSKMKVNSQSLKEIVDDKIFRGVSTGKNEVFIINKSIADELINDKNKSFIRKIVTGKEVKRNSLTFDDLYLLYIPWEYDLDFDENIKQYLLNNKDILANRPEVKEGRFNWWCLSRYGSKNSKYLFKPKIIYPRINNQCNFYYDHTGEYSLSDNNFFISTEINYLLPILNSKLVYFYLKSIASTLQGGYLDFRRPYVETIPIIKPKNDSEFEVFSKKNIHLNDDFHDKILKFTKYLQSQFTIEKLVKKLENWYELDFGDFIKELNKAIKVTNKERIKNDLQPIKELTKLDEMDWMDVFENKKAEAQALKQQIDSADREIDAMVYELYGLSEEEIAIVENS
jgi:type I restriction-modification system DNA methylase subunit